MMVKRCERISSAVVRSMRLSSMRYLARVSLDSDILGCLEVLLKQKASGLRQKGVLSLHLLLSRITCLRVAYR